jgi:hypothetical protein
MLDAGCWMLDAGCWMLEVWAEVKCYFHYFINFTDHWSLGYA